MTNEIASRYGDALFEIAYENNDVISYQENMKQIRLILKENPSFLNLLENSFLSMDERVGLIDKTFIGVNKNIVSFLKIIVEQGRVKYLFDIFQAFNSQCNCYRGIKEGLLYSTYPLQESEIKQVQNKIEKLENTHLELTNIIDPQLIGGIKVVVNDHVYDDSIKSRLDKMRNTLLKKED